MFKKKIKINETAKTVNESLGISSYRVDGEIKTQVMKALSLRKKSESFAYLINESGLKNNELFFAVYMLGAMSGMIESRHMDQHLAEHLKHHAHEAHAIN